LADSALAFTAKPAQRLLVEFRFLGDWPQFSLDLNSLDFSICSVLQAKVQALPHRNFSVLHLSIAGEWDPLAAECIRKTCHSFRRLRYAVTKKNEVYMEYMVSQSPNP
jgi:hypothetical protein